MAYYSGSSNDFTALRTAIFSACVANGWTLSSDILSKGSAFVRLYISAMATSAEGIGLIAQGGTGESEGALVGGTDIRPRIGLPGLAGSVPAIDWPIEYFIHVHTAPDEIYCVIRTSVDRYFYVAFGVSDIPDIGGTGLWVSGTSYRGYASGTVTSWTTGVDYGTEFYGAQGEGCPAPFWSTLGGSQAQYKSDVMNIGLDSVGWAGRSISNIPSVGSINASLAAAPHVVRSPSAWNQDSPLLPIQVYLCRASSKLSLVLDVRHARYLRIDNYEPEQVITLGSDSWKVYPFQQKNAAVRDGGNKVSHTGTLGWAIRYDGS